MRSLAPPRLRTRGHEKSAAGRLTHERTPLHLIADPLLPAGRRNNAVHPQIFDHLAIVVERMPGEN